MRITDVIKDIEAGKDGGPLGKLRGNYDIEETMPSACKIVCPECNETIVSAESEYLHQLINKKERRLRMLVALVAAICIADHKYDKHSVLWPGIKHFEERFRVRFNGTGGWIKCAKEISADNNGLLNSKNCAVFEEFLEDE